MRTLSELCFDCDGRGYTKSALSVVYDIFRDIRRIGRSSGRQTIVIGANPRIVELLLDSEHEGVELLERDGGHHIAVNSDPLLHLEQYDIVVIGGTRAA